MRWTLVEGKLATENGEPVEEGQSIEFKESLGSARRQEGIQTLVAFANAERGRVFFGVENDGKVKGVQVGQKTLEDLANEIGQHTYPSLPAYIDQFRLNGKNVVIAEMASDTPPVVGVYLYSNSPIPPDQPVDANKLQAFRRVGRTTQKEDFMRLRQGQPSDPRLRIALGGGVLGGGQTSGPSFPSEFTGIAWVEEGSATAHDVSFHLDPPICECSASRVDLPYPFYSGGEYGFSDRRNFTFSCTNVPTAPPSTVKLIATYKDDYGLTWESARRLELVIDPGNKLASLVDGGEFTRRIVRFPPKVRQ